MNSNYMLGCIALFTACASPRATNPEGARDAQEVSPPHATADPQAPEKSKTEVSADVDTIRPLLMARHGSDLPSRQTLSQHSDPSGQLRRLATTDPMLVVRARALTLLRHYPGEACEAVVVAQIDDPNGDAMLRAAAVYALAGWPLTQRSDLREKIVGAVRSADLRVAVNAALVLAQSMPDHPDVVRLRQSADLPEPVRNALAAP